MENALVVYKTGVVHFNNYEDILNQARTLANHLEGVEVTEDTVKASKKMIAEVRKKVDELDSARKDIKKEVLASYTEFEEKVKSITTVVREAENLVRSQVRTLEEIERGKKEQDIYILFEKRSKLYPTLSTFTHLNFLESRHLNKSTSMKKIEEEMVQWFEHTKKAVEYIGDLQDAKEIMVEYLSHGDAIKAVETVKERKKRIEQVSVASGVTTFTIGANSEMEVKYIENILTAHGIEFIKQ